MKYSISDPQILEKETVKSKSDKPKNLILYNDDVNTFDFVIETLIKVCGHDSIQAEQCTFLVHYAGKCAVKEGSYKALKPYRDALTERGLDAKIEG
jgi:ATP-dependent Clp protease adaptor protein ClpS